MIKLHVFIFIYIANLDCHDLNVSALAALAPPIICKCKYAFQIVIDHSSVMQPGILGFYSALAL